MDTFTRVHVIISVIGIASGFVVLFGLLGSQRLDRWTALFLVSTLATSVTGFLFPFHGVTPAIVVGIVSLIVLAVAIYARYVMQLAGVWCRIYVVAAMLALYLNFFVLIVQSFQKISPLRALAPNQTELPFILAQVLALVFFIVVTILAARRFRV